ncbi:MAG: hypothetical protein K1X94_14180, partial [Sandaracinaceae bacterium]|nr:hypothetical protein [Sandaracinaceae bacterium]
MDPHRPSSLARSHRVASLSFLGAGALLGAVLRVPLGSFGPILTVALASALVLVGLRTDRRPRSWVGPAIGLLALLATSGRRPPPLLPAGPAELEGLVIAVESDGVLLEVAEARSGDAPLPVARARASIEGEVGEEVAVRGVLAPVVPFRNESPHPSFDVARSTVRVREPELLS